MDDCECESQVLLVLADRRKSPDAMISDFKNGFRSITFLVADLGAMMPLDAHLFHFVGNRMFSISRKTIHAGAHREVCTCGLRRGEELINITLAVTNMNAALRVV
jgi:hypothetical protein